MIGEPEFVEALPGNPREKSLWLSILAPLVDRPGEWAIVRRDSPSAAAAATTAAQMRRGHLKLPPGRWEFASRKVDNEFRVYARYLGPETGA